MWRNVLIKWVNCLGLQDTPIQKISELGDGKFFNSLLNVISYQQKHGISTDEADKAVTEFLKYEYPFYVRESESCEMEDLEIMYVTSLLMSHCILEGKNKKIMEHVCQLNDETQVYIKTFFEIIMQYDNNKLTRNVVKHAVSECGNKKSLKETRKKHSTEYSLIGFSIPKCSPIMDVVQSPLAQKLKQLSEQRAMIRRLNKALEAEEAQNVLLQEQLQQERDKTKKLTKQLIDRNDEMKKLREDWLYGDSESNEKMQCSSSCQEVLLKKEIKDLETYISSLHGDIDILQNKEDLLQQRVSKAEHQYQVWYAEAQQSEALCEKLKHDVVEKECELAHTQELCSELQRQVHEMKQVHNISVEEDPYIMSPGCRTPENLSQAVIDLRLQEQQEENKIITEQLKKMVIEDEAMKKQICDLHIRSENVEHEAAALKATNLELRGKVDEMEDLQHELEECRVEQGRLYEELDVSYVEESERVKYNYGVH